MFQRAHVFAALLSTAVLVACGNEQPNVAATPSSPTSASSMTSAFPPPTFSSSPPQTSTAPSATTDSATPSASTSSAQASESPAAGVAAGRLGDNFVAVFESEGSRQLGLFAKDTGKLVNDLGVTLGPGDAQPQASADGQHVYFLHGSGDACDAGLYRVPIGGGGAERLVDPREQVDAFALNTDGTKVMAVRHLGCGSAATKRVLTEFDAETGAVVNDRAVIAGDDTAVTALAWHERSGQVAVARSGRGSIDQVETFGLLGTGTTQPATLQLPTCLGRIRSIEFTNAALYVARDCMNPENAAKAGHIYRALDSDDVERIVETAAGTTVAGMHAEHSGSVVFSTVRWLEEDDEGPTTVYVVTDGQQTKLFEVPEKRTELVW